MNMLISDLRYTYIIYMHHGKTYTYNFNKIKQNIETYKSLLSGKNINKIDEIHITISH